MPEGFFSCTRDREVIAAGGFFCTACLVGRPADDKSPDPRYCQKCYDFLLDEAAILPPTKRPAWIPKKGALKAIPPITPPVGIMSTLDGEKNKVDIIAARTADRPAGKRGPKFTELPDALIKQLSADGQGSKVIAAELARQGYPVSYKTIQRRLQGGLL